MFYYIEGVLAYLDINFAVIDAHGVGYKLTITQNTYSALPHSSASGDAPRTRLYTYMAVREDDVELFGFATHEELDTFKLLITVSGVGPKAAISILSVFSPEGLTAAVCNEDTKSISKANGIGAKTAARIVLELKDKLTKAFSASVADRSPETISATSAQSGGTALSDAQSALAVLGYSKNEILAAIRQIDTTNKSTNDIIRLALKHLSNQ